MPADISFDERLTVAVPVAFRDAVRTAAHQTGLTVADYARAALAERMCHDGVHHPFLPLLSTDHAHPHPPAREGKP